MRAEKFLGKLLVSIAYTQAHFLAWVHEANTTSGNKYVQYSGIVWY